MSDIQEVDSTPEAQEQADIIDQVAVEDSPKQEPSKDSEPESLSDIIKAARDDVSKADDQVKADNSADDKRESEQVTKGGKSESEPDAQDDDAEQNQQTEIEAPQDWDKPTKDAFASLPTAEARQAMLDVHKNMQAGFTRKSQEQADTVRFAEAVRSQIDEQTRMRIAAEGRDEVGYINQLVGLERFARSQPVEYIKTAMQTLGVRPEQIGIAPLQPANEVEADEYADPDYAALRQQMSGLEGSIDQKMQNAFQQMQQQQEMKAWQQTIDQFSTEKDAEGNVMRPHFDKVRGDMASLYQAPSYQSIADSAKRLQATYEAAVRAHPELGPQFLKEEADKAAEAERQRQEVERAKRAKQPVKPSQAPAQAAAEKASLREIISEASRAATSGHI